MIDFMKHNKKRFMIDFMKHELQTGFRTDLMKHNRKVYD